MTVRLFLVVKTKGYEKISDIPPEEQQKMKYAKKFFKALQNKLPNIKILHQTRMNKQDLSDLLKP